MMGKLIATLAVVVLFFSPLSAQSQANTADLVGVITDQTGAILPGVELTVVNTETGRARLSISNDDGSYRIPLLPPGTYEVRASLEGFSTALVQGVVLTVGQYADLDIELKVSASQEVVVVLGNAAIIETQKTVQASTVQEKEIDNLPINGRNFLDFTLLTPGVSDSSTFVTDSAVQTPTSGLSFGGQDQRSNYITIDGVDNMDVISNSVRSTLSQEAIQEFQISRNTFSAEFGRARAGVINIVSKSGGNKFHGNAFWFFRNNSLDARNTFAAGDPDFERHQFGGTVGGPIVEDRTFFFASYERLDRQETIFVTFLDDDSIFGLTPAQNDLFSFFRSSGIPSLEFLDLAFTAPGTGVLLTSAGHLVNGATFTLFDSESGDFPFQADQDTFSIKVDHEISANNQLNFRFNFTDQFSDGVEFGALDAVSNGVQFDSQDFTFVAADTHIFSPSNLNDFKFQYARREFAVPTNDPFGPQISFSGIAEFGREFFNPSAYDQNIFQFVDNFTHIAGNHTLKFGIDLNVLDLSGSAEVFLGGEFTFAQAIPLASILDSALGTGTAAGLINQLSTSLGRPDLASNVLAPISAVQAFNFGLPITYFQGFGDPNTAFTYTQLGTYLQDNWQIKPNFTVNLGVRYDVDFKPATSNIINTAPPWQFSEFSLNDNNNIAPRLGFAWDVGGRGSSVLRGGYGLYYSNFFQAVAFVSQVLSGQISQVFLPITGLSAIGIDATSADVFEQFQNTGVLDASTLQAVGVNPGTTPSVILPAAGNTVNPHSQQVSFGYEQRIDPDTSLSLDYIFNRGGNLIRSRDINLRQTGPNSFRTPGLDPRFVQVNMLETSGSSVYHGFTAAFSRRFRSASNIRLSYTLGKAIDDTTDFITQLQPNNQTNIAAERSLSSFDQRHRFVTSVLYSTPWQMSSGNSIGKNILADWTFSTINTVASGKPFNLVVGFDLNGDTHEETDRPVLSDGTIAGRNTGSGPSQWTTDIRLARKFHFRDDVNFEFIFEAFNLWNRVNFSGINNTVGPTIANANLEGSENIPANRPLGFTSAFAPRQIQFGFRFNF